MKHDLTGQRFGKLVALEYGKGGWKCVCDCGKEALFYTDKLRRGNNQSCGCMATSHRKRERHGMAASPEYRIWGAIKKRCLNPRSKDYPHYGGRGITICDKWKDSFDAFIADVGPRPDGTWIDRLDNSKNYEPGNVAWRTPSQQQRNKRDSVFVEIRGEKITFAEAVEKYAAPGISYYTVRSRRRYGWSLEDALTKPLRGTINAA